MEEIDGMGVRGKVGGQVVFAGNRRLVSLCSAEIPAALENRAAQWEQAAMTVVFFGWDHVTEGFLVFGDPLREGARELTDWLRARGTRVLILSGDSRKTTGAVAGILGIEDYFGQKMPVEKAEIIKELNREGLKVGLVGDGINDAAAMAAAQVGFALGAGNDILKSASDLIIPGANPSVIMDAFRLAAQSRRTTRQNLSFAFLYNVTAIPVAAMGLLNPLIAVAAMLLSSLTLTGNALRVSRKV
jgi:Cu+-exporting ATPase